MSATAVTPRGLLRLAGTGLLLVHLVACGGGSGGGGERDLTVLAASSLTGAFEEMGRRFERSHPGVAVRFSFGGSSTLATHIVEGAPASVFASADTRQMGVVAAEGLVTDPVVFATNHLVVVVPETNPARIERAEDLARPGVRVVLAAPEVPAGNYARAAFGRLGLRSQIESNVVSNEEEVSAVLAKVRLGEADAGVVYVTDVTEETAPEVETFPFPPRADIVARYSIATIEGSVSASDARSFVSLVVSDEGGAILGAHGFEPP